MQEAFLEQADYYLRIQIVWRKMREAIESYGDKELNKYRYRILKMDTHYTSPSVEGTDYPPLELIKDPTASSYWDFIFIYSRETNKLYKVKDRFLVQQRKSEIKDGSNSSFLEEVESFF